MKTKITFLVLIIMTVTGFSQPVVKWENSFGGSNSDGNFSVGGIVLSSSILMDHTLDGGYIVAGLSDSNDGDVTGNHGEVDFWVFKLSSDGTLEWQKSLGGSLDDYVGSIQQTLDGGYIVGGSSRSDNGDVTENKGNSDFWIVKLSTTGVLEWQKSLGGSGYDYANSIQQTTDGGYIVGGTSSSSDGDVTENKGKSDYWIVKLNSGGILEWQKSYGGSQVDDLISIQPTTDGGYIAAGSTSSDDGDVTGRKGSDDYWIVKLDVSGNLEWERTYGGAAQELLYSIQQTTDGGYIVAGATNLKSGDVSEHFGSYDYWIIKLSSSGSIEWDKSYGGGMSDIAHSILQTTDGGYIISGSSTSNDGQVTGNKGQEDFWIVKTNGTGSIEWQKSVGGSNIELAPTVLQVSNSDYIVAGASFSNDGDVSLNRGLSDIWIAQLTPFLGVDDNDLSTVVLYPNPNNGQFYINLSSLNEVSSISIVDVLGRLVYSDTNVSSETVEINQNLAAGMYVVTVKSGASAANLKMIVK